MLDPVRIAERYIALWNEADPDRRKALLAEGWAEDAHYVDPLMRGTGHDEIAALIAGVQARFPAFSFALAGRPDGVADHVRFSWELGPPQGESLVKGTDFVRLENGRLKSVTGFLDQVPAA